MLRDLVHRTRALFRRRTVERELADELRFHLEQSVERHMASGMTPTEAQRLARLEFGGIAQIAEACRDARGVSVAEITLQDLAYGWRTMRRSPMLSIAAVGTMTLATAAIACVGSLADALLWRAIPVDASDSLITVAATRGRPGDGVVSYPDYVSLRDRARTVNGLAAHYSTAPLFVVAGGQAREVNGAVVSANYFPLLGMQPALGRFFGAEEDRVPDRDRVVVLGYDLWQSWFAASPSAIGSVLTINGSGFTIIGVARSRPPGLTPMPVGLYIPTMMLRVGYRWCDDALAVSCTVVSMIGRLAPGRTLADASSEFAAIMPAAWAGAPIGENRGLRVSRPRGMSEDDQEPRLVATLGVVAIVLLIVCCANLGGLLSAQSAVRQTEFGVRMSLGAGPLRIVRQVLTESLLLALVGGAGGLLLSRVFMAALARMFFAMDDEGHPLSYDFSQSAGVTMATLAVAVAAGVLFAVLPAIRAMRAPLIGVTPARSTAPRWSAARWLLAAQAAIAVAMLAIAALLAFSARSVLEGRNYDTSHVALMRVRPRLVQYTPQRAQQFHHQVIERLRAMGSVESVSMVGLGSVLSGGSARVSLPTWAPEQQLAVHYNEVGPAYFATLRTPIVAGREFDDRDTAESPRVAIVTDSLAARLWPEGAWIGSSIVIGQTRREVIGVVADLAIHSRRDSTQFWAFAPFWQNSGQVDSRLAIRTTGDPALLLPDLAREVHRVDPAVPIAETITLPTRIAALTRPVRVGALFIGYAAALAMLLTAVGLYAALAFAVSARTKEIGIRVALGAAGARLIGSIVGEGLTVVVAGAAIGVALAAAATKVVASLLYAPAAADWMFYAGSAGLVTAVGVGASLLPAYRAAAVQPIVALRQD